VDDDELFKLNSLHRFAKTSKLVLEAHSHCEVPAGCGGAVLQWINPARGAPVRVRAQSPFLVKATFLDGEPISSAGTRLLPGPHLLALALTPPTRKGAKPVPAPWLLVGMTVRSTATEDAQLATGCSAADGSWRATQLEPAQAGWTSATFDDAHWAPLARAENPGQGLAEWEQESFRALLEARCVPLALPPERPVWVRKRFVLQGRPP
jgi:hypothetical protein